MLDLYDTGRLRYPVQIVDGKPQEVTTFDAFDKMVSDALTAGSRSAGTADRNADLPYDQTNHHRIPREISAGSKHIQYDADSYSGLLLGAEASYGKRAIPAYHFEKADVIVSLGADFLGTWLTPVEFAHQYVQNRKIDEKNPRLSKHYQFESIVSLTGSQCRLPVYAQAFRDRRGRAGAAGRTGWLRYGSRASRSVKGRGKKSGKRSDGQ